MQRLTILPRLMPRLMARSGSIHGVVPPAPLLTAMCALCLVNA
eukprot:COSAG02_NODE_1281_length_13472_cov_8.763048_6_plen_43_part_00